MPSDAETVIQVGLAAAMADGQRDERELARLIFQPGFSTARLITELSGRGVAYWSDGNGDDRIVTVTPGYQLVALSAKTAK